MSPRRRATVGGALIALVAAAPSAAAAPPEEHPPIPTVAPDFDAAVRPILARHCYACHGPDGSSREAQLRLDDAESATRARGRRPAAIVPGSAAASPLLHRITAADPEERMPPEGPPLTADEIDVLRRWIDAGAAWATHWSRRPIDDPAPPPVADETWPLDPIDRFVLASLEARGIAPAPPADRETLLRRLSIDLTGLPPTIGELDDFLADPAPDAWERRIDALLDSPRFGERWGRHWLDLVRYAETHGHEFDYPIPEAWRYRDWVIRAIDDDLPFDDFLREQIAGDLLEEPRRDPASGANASIAGTGWWFLYQATHGPTDVAEDRALRVADQLDVIGRAMLATTITCARCHDHKFDPVTQADYTALSGIARSTRRGYVELDPGGAIAAGIAAIDAERRQLAEAIAVLRGAAPEPPDPAPWCDAARAVLEIAGAKAGEEAELDAAIAGVAAERGLDPAWLGRWTRALRAGGPLRGAAPPREGDRILFGSDGSGSLAFAASGAAWIENAPEDLFAFDGAPRFVPRGAAHSGRHGAAPTGAWRSDDFTIDADFIDVRLAGTGGRVRLVVEGFHLDEWNALLFEGLIAPAATGDPARFRWHRMRAGLHRGRRAHLEALDEGGGMVVVDAIRATDDPVPPQDRPEPVEAEALRVAVAAWLDGDDGPEAQAWIDWALGHRLLEPGGAVDRAAQRIAALDAAIPAPTRVLTAVEGPGADAPLFRRGDVKQPEATVPRGFIASIPGAERGAGAGSGRRHLADRILDDANPLTARVAANRVWLHLFGRGIVPTPDDFGVLGTPPANPALLDHLASRLRGDLDWSVKGLIRAICRSRTYRMAATTDDAEAASRDPLNALPHRASLRRLDAETLRDAMLAISGRLDLEPFGPPVPVHLTPFMTGRGRPGRDGPLDGAGRRSVWIEVRRNFLSPFLQAFDRPIPAAPVGRRHVSNVPAQALVLMNDPFVAEQAALWARRAEAAHPADRAARAATMMRAAWARRPGEAEVAAALDFVAAQRVRRAEAGAAEPESAAWADFAHALFQTKDFLFVR